MQRVIDIPLQPLDGEAFEPFGQIIGTGDGPPVFTGPHVASWRRAFECEDAVELMFSRYVHQAMEFTCMESHLNVTQCFIPLGDHPSVMVVAPPDDGRAGPPTPEAVRAFFVPGDRGMLLWRRTWHALTRFPALPHGAEFVLLTSAATQRELERERQDGTPPELTRGVDFAAEMDVFFRVVDPLALIPGAAAG